MKKALLVVSFGTSYPDTCEKNIVACERELAVQLPGPRHLSRLHLRDDYPQAQAARRYRD